MEKSPTQLMLEAQRGQDIKVILRDTLEEHRHGKNMVVNVGLALGVSYATVYRWCEDLGIDIEEYRRPIPEDPAPSVGTSR